jgi:molybdate transport system substrate-binding protein
MRALRFVAVAVVVLSAACGKQPLSAPTAAKPSAEPIIVSAAASTKEVVESLCKEFSKSSGVDVRVNAGASNALATQILAGAPADLFLSANAKWAAEVEKADLTVESTRLLTNGLVIVVPKDNPGEVREPGGLMSEKVKKVALAGEKVPAGMYADQALTKLSLLKSLTDAGKIVRGQDVRTALSYIERGEVEAGIVYSTDAQTAANLKIAYEFDPKLHDEIVYVLVLLKHGSSNSAAQKLYDFLKSPEANNTYQKFGFARLPAGGN